jgi:glucan phosphoethanolaminetransferase (alkaline phosphatase superfamily)
MMWGGGNSILSSSLINDKSDCSNKYETLDINNNTYTQIIFIVSDALTSKHMSCYGYARKTTPFLDSLIENGKATKIENAYSNSSSTHVGLTGIFMSQEWDKFSYKSLSLMEVFKNNGFSTQALLTGNHRNWYGISNLYSRYCDNLYESANPEEGANFDDYKTINKLYASPINVKSFTYLHLLSTHETGEKKEHNNIYLPNKEYFLGEKGQATINNYDNGVFQIDQILKMIYHWTISLPSNEKTLIILTADHGESLGENGIWGHAGNLSPAKLNIPLIFIGDIKDKINELEFASNLDIAPTLATLAGINVPECWQGVSLSKRLTSRKIKLNSGSNCDIPFGILTRRNDTLNIDILKKNNELHERHTTSINRHK